MFHRTLDAARFDEQLAVLCEDRTPVTGAAVATALDGGAPLPPGALWLTFDDAYRDFQELAWPVLEARGLTVTLFVPTGFPSSGREFWWERLASAILTTTIVRVAQGAVPGWPEALDLGAPLRRQRLLREARERVKSLPHAAGMVLVDELVRALGDRPAGPEARCLGWDELRVLAARGVELANHTQNHPMLDQVTEEEARVELRAGFADLEREVPGALRVVAYPSGHCNPAIARLAREEGARCAVTTEAGIVRPGTDDRWLLKRVPIGPHADATAVRLRLALARPLVQRLLGRSSERGWS